VTLNDLEPAKIGVFSGFLVILGCDAHLKSAPKLLGIDQDNLRMKLN